jgi:hypothetical protein
LTLGYYENFPKTIHEYERFSTPISSKKLQQNLIQILYDINRKELSFEEIVNPTIPNGIVILEFGLAEQGNFNFINKEELEKALKAISKSQLEIMDFFCVIRYYKYTKEKKTALKFDYYMLRTTFAKGTLEFQIFHERGPRYISPKELMDFLQTKLNEDRFRKILTENEPQE